jgi:hypothetical protein
VAGGRSRRTTPSPSSTTALRQGDSLVGLDFEQIRNFHWKVPDKKPSAQLDLFGREIAVALDDAIQLRQLIGTLGDSPVEDREKARLFWDAQDALDRIRLISDLVVGAFFAHDKDKDRETERAKREAMVRDWLLTGSPPTRQLLEMQLELHASLSPFHWMVEFPEVFYAERPDPLDQNQACRAAHMDAFVGNPPFAGKNAISEIGGAAYIPWLQAIHVSSHGNADLCAHFFRRAAHLIGDHGSIGLLGTNTIAQGDTRRTGLQPMLAMGFQIYHANENLTWPGEAAVIVSAIHLGAGTIAATTSDQKELNGTPASSINSHLRIDRERPEPHPLARNSGLTLVGCFLAGSGFVLEGDEAAILVRADPANSSVIRPFLGGEDFNRNPRQDSSRFVIDFGELDYGAAKQWPQLLSLVEQRVRPDRAKARHDRREYWWLFAGRAPRIKSYLDENGRILAVAQTAPHYAFAFVPSGTTIANTLIAFLMDGWTPFAILQSRIHEPWTRLLSSSLAGTLRYSPSDCFETFPFPRSDPREAILSVDCAAKHLHNSRAKYMTEQNIGLTATYNRLKDLACIDAQVLESRSLHEQMDRAVLDAYGWTDIEVPPYCPMNDEDRQKVSKFENEVIDRLFALNAKRAEEERIAGLGAPGAKKPKKASAAKKPRAKKGAPQLTFGEPATEPDADDD